MSGYHIGRHTVTVLALASAFASAALPARVPIPFERLPESHGIVELAGEYREVVWSADETAAQRLPLEEDGGLVLRVGEHFDWPAGDTADYAVQLEVRPTATPVPNREDFDPVHVWVSRDVFDDGVATLPVFPEGRPAPEALVRTRVVHPSSRVWRSEPFVVPDSPTLSVDYGLRSDWNPEAFEPTITRIHARAVPEEGEPVELFSRAISSDLFLDQWRRVEMDLTALAGQTIRLELAAEKVEVVDGASFEAFWSVPMLGTAERDEDRPNVVLISLDTLRRDRLGLMGYERDTSPRLDQFAKESVVFENAVSPSTWTTPSHASMFTGALPWVHGAGMFQKGFVLDQDWETIAESARDAGYSTAAFTEGVAVGGRLGFAQGFERYSDGPTFEDRDRSGSSAATFGQAGNWAALHAAEPFFLFVHTFEIHAPYCSPAPEGTAFAAEEAGASNCIYEQQIDSPETGARASDLYDGGVLFTDFALETLLLNRLRTAGLLEDTIVIITSDHGEEFGEHGDYGHTSQIYGEVINVPLIIRVPGIEPGRVPDLVGTRDLYATLGEMMQLPREGLNPGAQSLVSLLRAGDPPSYRRDVIYSFMSERHAATVMKTGVPHEYSHYAITSLDGRFMMRDRAWMQQTVAGETVTAPEWERFGFDLQADPGEQQNVIEDPPDTVVDLEQRLREQLKQDGAHGHLIQVGEKKDSGELSEEALERLEAMGYF